jgi:hypothetical protein
LTRGVKAKSLKQGLGVRASERSTGILTPTIDPLMVLLKLVTLYETLISLLGHPIVGGEVIPVGAA